MAVAGVAVYGSGQHQPLGCKPWRQGGPELPQQQGTGLFWPQGQGLRWLGRRVGQRADLSFEVPVQLGAIAVGQARLQYLATDQGPWHGWIAEP